MSTVGPPHHVRVPLNVQRWADLTFLHWSYPPEVVAELLPPGLRVHTHRSRAWVGVTPFRMEAVRVPPLPAVPHLSFFPEINVRTYVRGEDGVEGIWFFSLDCARLPVIAALRVLGLPYVWADAAARPYPDDGTLPRRVAYRSRRRVPAGEGPAGVGLRAAVTVGDRIEEPGDLVNFLTARWWAFSRRAGRLWRVPAEHEPWPLYEATARVEATALLTAAGLPLPGTAPLTHFSPGVETRLGAPRPG